MSEVDSLYVVTTVFNPMRYKSRYALYEQFRDHMESLGARLMTVELALGDRPFEVTERGNPMHVQLRTDQEFWLKESALNVGISKLPDDWKYVMWCDADVTFARADILEETVHQLQHYDIVQCFEDAIDLGPRGEVLETHKGFAWSWWNKEAAAALMGSTVRELDSTRSYYYADAANDVNHGFRQRTSTYHTGFVWAARRQAYTDLGGLFDTAILGAGDHHLSYCLAGQILSSIPADLSIGYKRELLEWQKRADMHIRQNFGHVPGTIFHAFHGSKRERFYRSRWQILLDHAYEPDTDLKRDWNGLWALTHHGQRMRNALRRYFVSRNEDAL